MTPLIIATALGLMALDSTAATSQPAAAPAKTAAPATSNPADDQDKVICKNQPITGSRFVKRICMTRSEWGEQQHRLEELQRRINQNPNAPQSGGLSGG